MEIKINIDPVKIKNNLKKVKDEIVTDISVIRERDPAATSNIEVALLYSGFHAVLAYRLSHKLYEKNMHFAARMVSQGARFLTGIEIHPGAKIGRGLIIDHGSAVNVGIKYYSEMSSRFCNSGSGRVHSSFVFGVRNMIREHSVRF